MTYWSDWFHNNTDLDSLNYYSRKETSKQQPSCCLGPFYPDKEELANI